ncbi:MAG: hypothetical protein ABSH19_00715 [Opitutales bacterium]
MSGAPSTKAARVKAEGRELHAGPIGLEIAQPRSEGTAFIGIAEDVEKTRLGGIWDWSRLVFSSEERIAHGGEADFMAGGGASRGEGPGEIADAIAARFES